MQSGLIMVMGYVKATVAEDGRASGEIPVIVVINGEFEDLYDKRRLGDAPSMLPGRRDVACGGWCQRLRSDERSRRLA